MAQIIDGEAIAADIRREISADVAALSSAHNLVPGLAVVIVGCRKDSQTYVQMKRKACAEVGIRSVVVDLPEDISEAAFVAEVHRLNADPAVHGILVQLPLPKHINEEKILNEISIEKDVDGFHPLNIGKLAMKGRDPLFLPCMPKGCMELLSRSGITVKGKRAVVVGRSNIVGLPVSLLLLKVDAIVSIVHSRTPNPESIVCEADIIIAAAGQAMMIKGDWIKPGAVVIDVGNIVIAFAAAGQAMMIKGDWIKPGAAVIDVGTNSVDDPTRKSGYRLVGDVNFAEVSKVAGHLTPVPGGVGPMTVAMLLKNTLEADKAIFGEPLVRRPEPPVPGNAPPPEPTAATTTASSSSSSPGSPAASDGWRWRRRAPAFREPAGGRGGGRRRRRWCPPRQFPSKPRRSHPHRPVPPPKYIPKLAARN